jgi:hypothetical protein
MIEIHATGKNNPIIQRMTLKTGHVVALHRNMFTVGDFHYRDHNLAPCLFELAVNPYWLDYLLKAVERLDYAQNLIDTLTRGQQENKANMDPLSFNEMSSIPEKAPYTRSAALTLFGYNNSTSFDDIAQGSTLTYHSDGVEFDIIDHDENHNYDWGPHEVITRVQGAQARSMGQFSTRGEAQTFTEMLHDNFAATRVGVWQNMAVLAFGENKITLSGQTVSVFLLRYSEFCPDQEHVVHERHYYVATETLNDDNVHEKGFYLGRDERAHNLILSAQNDPETATRLLTFAQTGVREHSDYLNISDLLELTLHRLEASLSADPRAFQEGKEQSIVLRHYMTEHQQAASAHLFLSVTAESEGSHQGKAHWRIEVIEGENAFTLRSDGEQLDDLPPLWRSRLLRPLSRPVRTRQHRFFNDGDFALKQALATTCI